MAAVPAWLLVLFSDLLGHALLEIHLHRIVDLITTCDIESLELLALTQTFEEVSFHFFLVTKGHFEVYKGVSE